MAESPPYPGTPRWVKAFGAALAVLIVLLVLAKAAGVGGRHGPGRHLPSGDRGGEPATGAAGEPAPDGDGRR